MKCKITFIANHGIMIDSNSNKILIDAIQEGEEEFSRTPNDVTSKILMNEYPFEDVKILLFTHSHNDHFSYQLVSKILSNNNKIHIIADELSSKKLTSNSLVNPKNIKSLHYNLYEPKEINIDNIKIIALPLPHYGCRENSIYNVANFAYIIVLENVKILVTGDGEANEEYYKKYLDYIKDIDIAVVCFPYIFTTRALNVVTNYINPKHIIVNHIPVEENDSYKIRPQLLRYYNKNKEQLPPTVFFDKYLDVFEL